MPRKKPNSESTTNSVSTPKVKKQITKPKLKTPTVIKVKIPTQKPVEQKHQTRSTKKSLNLARKIELANEVADLQLAKKPSIVVSIKNDIKKEFPDDPVTTPVVKRSRKSKKTTQSLDPTSETNDKATINGEQPAVNDRPTAAVNQPKVIKRKPSMVKRNTMIDRKSITVTRKVSIDGRTKIAKRKISIDGKVMVVKRKESVDGKVVKRKNAIDGKTIRRKTKSIDGKASNQKTVDKNKTPNGETTNQSAAPILNVNQTTNENISNTNKVTVSGKTPKRAKPNSAVEKTPATRKKLADTQQIKKNVEKTTSRVNNITRYLTVTKKHNEGKKNISKDDNIIDSIGIPTAVEKRKESVASSTNLSWTKDFSSSNTSISARSNDIVRIDNKLPILRLIKVDDIKQEKIDKDEISTSSESSDFSEPHNIYDDKIDIADDLNLSTSSITTINEAAKVTIDAEKNSVRDELRKAFDKLSYSLKKFDTEIMKWIGHSNDDVEVNFQNKILNVLKEERDVLDNCRRLKNYLKGTNDTQDILDNRASKNQDEVDFVKPAEVPRKIRDGSESDDVFLSFEGRDCMLNQNMGTPLLHRSTQNSNEDNIRNDNARFSIDGHNYEDDDALSIFAESITGIESSRLNISNVSNKPPVVTEDEYIPKPVTENPIQTFTYLPTKIDEKTEAKKTICKKQTADSTSVGKEYYDALAETAMASFEEDYQASAMEFDETTPDVPTCSVEKTSDLLPFKLKSPYKYTVIFKNICFKFLQSRCKNVNCRYPHFIPEDIHVRSSIADLSQEGFEREYIFLRDFTCLRRRYGFCFVEECEARKLTRHLLEMAIDFTVKATIGCDDDSNLQLLVLESVLMYLNNVNLVECGNLLLYNITPLIMLCDLFMVTIAMTQNFSRFKAVFMSLTRYMVENDKIFSNKVAIQVLERVCILPHEEALSHSVIEILKRTDASIFQSSMADIFERQLALFNKGLLEEYLASKTQGLLSQPLLNVDTDSLAVNVSRADEMYTSPDTTNVDTMLKPPEPVKTRPIDINTARYNNYSSPNSSVAEWPKYFQNWRRPAMPNASMAFFRPPKRHTGPPRRKVMYHPPSRSHPPKYKRRNARDF